MQEAHQDGPDDGGMAHIPKISETNKTMRWSRMWEISEIYFNFAYKLNRGSGD